MKALKIRYFAAYREAVGRGEETLQSVAATTGELFDELCERHPNLSRYDAMKVAVNDALGDWSTQLQDGDVVFLFPPVAGG